MEPHIDERGSVSRMLRLVRVGDDVAAAELWQRCFPKLVAIARRWLQNLPHRREDAEDAAQSAMISFWKKLRREDESAELDRNSMWKLLATIAIRKTRGQLRREGAQKRGAGAVFNESEMLTEYSGRRSLDDMLGSVSTGDFDVACEEWLMRLPDDLRPLAVLRVLGHTNEEIAKLLDCSARTVERKLQLIRDIWAQALKRLDSPS
jgi:RNA polymerase sigma factor (sigma-70 family)